MGTMLSLAASALSIIASCLAIVNAMAILRNR